MPADSSLRYRLASQALRPALYDVASRLIDYCYEPTPTDSAIVRRLTSLVELRRLGVYARQNVSGSAYISLRFGLAVALATIRSAADDAAPSDPLGHSTR